MFLYPKQFSQIRSFEIINGLYTNLKNDLFSFENNAISITNNILWLKFFNDVTIGLDSLNKPTIIKANQIDNSYQHSFRVNSVSYPFINFYIKTEPRTYGIFNYESSKIEFQTFELIGKDIFEKYLVNDNYGKIELREINFEQIIWSFNLSQLLPIPHKEFANENAPWEIKKFIGVLENKLWVAMNHRTIIALNCETGELVHTVSEIPGFEREWIHNSIPNTECIQLIPETSILLGFADDLIWNIDAKTGEISIKSYESLFKENRIKKYRNEFIIDGELLFFLSDQDPKIGCFNWKTEKLEWQYAFEKTEKGEYPRLTEIQGDRNKLGVKDLANNLYIFESHPDEQLKRLR